MDKSIPTVLERQSKGTFFENLKSKNLILKWLCVVEDMTIFRILKFRMLRKIGAFLILLVEITFLGFG